MSNSNSNPVCCPAIQSMVHKGTIVPKLFSLELVIVVSSFSKGVRLLCTAHQSTLGQPWRSSPAKYHQSAGLAAAFREDSQGQGSKPDTTTQAEEGVKGMSTERTSPAVSYQMILLNSCLTGLHHDKEVFFTQWSRPIPKPKKMHQRGQPFRLHSISFCLLCTPWQAKLFLSHCGRDGYIYGCGDLGWMGLSTNN